jgi:hypothetical protein
MALVAISAGFASGLDFIWSRPARGETLITPRISVSERYDSNVLFGGAAGNVGKLEDFVTSISPGLTVRHNGRLLQVTLTAGATGEVYVNNPVLNYVGVSGGINLDMSALVAKVIPRAGLRVSDSVLYTPQLPAFLTPEASGQTDFLRGIQTARFNTLTNAATVSATYALTQAVTLQASHSYQIIRFLNPVATPALGRLFDQETHSSTAGILVVATPKDSFGLNGLYTTTRFPEAEGFSFDSYGANGTYSRVLSQALRLSMFASALYVQPPFQSTQYTGGASLTWTAGPQTTASINYSRSVFASIAIQAVPLVSDMVTTSVSHRVTPKLTVTASANYAHNESIPAGTLEFNSYEGTVSLGYQLSRFVTANASYTYGNFQQEFLETRFDFQRHAVILGLSAAWPHKVD